MARLFHWQRHRQRGENMSEQPVSTSNFVTCHCEHCGGGIEFDANQLDPAQDVSVPCPHCEVETKLFLPEQTMPPVISDDTPPSAQSDEGEPAESPQGLSPSDQNAEVQGSIGYFGLADWWLNSLSEIDRARIISLYDSRQAKTLIEGTISRKSKLASPSSMSMGFAYHSSGLGFSIGINCVDFLIMMVNFKLNPEKAGYGKTTMTTTKDYGLRAKIIQQIIREVKKPDAEVIDKHVAYSFLAMIFYSERNIDQFAVQRAIWASLNQIEISTQIKLLIGTTAKTRTLTSIAMPAEVASSSTNRAPCYDAGYRFLAQIFQNEKQYAKLVALCEYAIAQGWEGSFWKDTLTKNRVYLGDESPASEWRPAMPELKWDETLLNVPTTIPAPEIKPKSDVPECDLRFVNGLLQPLTPEQNSFYLELVASIKNKTYLSVEGQEQYLNYYIREKYKTFDGGNLERLYDELLCLAVPYEEGKTGRGIFWRPKSWGYDCLLALESYDKYFETTKPANIFSIRTHFANQKCNVRYYLGMPTSGVDFLQIYGDLQNRITSFTKQHPKEFEQLLETVFAEEEKVSGSWFERILAESDRKDYQNHLFPCLHFARRSKIPNYCFYGASENLTARICDAFREAENRLRDLLGEKRVGEKWDEETKLFHAIKKMFPDLQVIHHGKPDWLGRMHFDIWIPELKIAIEYHGQQHFEEMKHFGGAESLEATQKRDALKRSACTREGVQLFEVTSPEEAQKAIGEIRRAASLKKDKQLAFPTL